MDQMRRTTVRSDESVNVTLQVEESQQAARAAPGIWQESETGSVDEEQGTFLWSFDLVPVSESIFTG